MRKTFLAVLTVATLASTGAFAETLTIGTAHQAPVFANASGNTTIVADVGTSSRAPAYALNSGNGSLVAQVGTASRAPVYAQDRRQNAGATFAGRLPDILRRDGGATVWGD